MAQAGAPNDGHVDYLHDGRLHHQAGDVVEEHVIEVSAKNPDRCSPRFGHKGRDATDLHGPSVVMRPFSMAAMWIT